MKAHDRGHENKKVLTNTCCNIRLYILLLVCPEFCRTARFFFFFFFWRTVVDKTLEYFFLNVRNQTLSRRCVYGIVIVCPDRVPSVPSVTAPETVWQNRPRTLTRRLRVRTIRAYGVHVDTQLIQRRRNNRKRWTHWESFFLPPLPLQYPRG